ncbi:TrkH family potassium uptake protein [Methanothermobacter sp. KEPCO-1]|uniref:Predicted potassium uptake protein TrkH n=1 Tax=Methanothermobacter marburgensis (strain ATCC BAA-927 / DSM 2133 / JCM 14651 / NBRC 100331 / OCM 82 / Marburg) TaxID=79929 RepID=D9PYD2_METTM|nr:MULTISPECIES: TrkH family potassium uptake protein [Methanothermobacter]ADL59230.1 predicted potassium uptake protein TrkH [Methanothermobacter marburgensis str. Marburg]QEF94606.1 TrkH family potassium uptake protein [Methanothermobacter sp. KEPCO-1]WBF09733.1 TrkH family potassium uptake protein [Methanothermobacter marburgensis]
MRYVGKRDLFTVGKYLGNIMQGIGFVVALPLIVALIYGEGNFLSFIVPSIISLSIGTVLKRYSPEECAIRLKHGMMVACLAWLWAGFIGSLIMMSALNIDFANAFFENMSAWTGSGLTVFSNVEALPKSILFLRSFEQWIGGLGVVIVVIGVLIRPGTAAARLYKSEAREERIKPSIANTVRTIWWIYLTYTVLGIVLYGLTGMPLFDAINNTLTNLSTGGMSIKNLNIGYYRSDAVYLVTMFLMILGGTSFLVHYQAIKGRFSNVLRDIQLQATFAFIILFTVLSIYIGGVAPLESVYYVISALSCTGSSISSTSQMVAWSGYFKIVLIICMLTGMAAGSTTGAVKIIRVITVLKGVYWDIMRILAPEGSVIPRKISCKSVSDAEIREAGSYISLYFILLFFTWSVLVTYGYDPLNSLFEAASAQGNVGLSMGITSFNLPLIPKMALILSMWLGRLEIIPVLVLIRGFVEAFKVN